MSATLNPLISAGAYLVTRVEVDSLERSLDGLFVGTVEEFSNRWAGSAVQDKEDNWHIVPTGDNVQDAGTGRRVKMYSGGAFGRAKFHTRGWFEENAVKIFFGALTLPRGSGSKAVHSVGDEATTIEVEDVTTSPANGVWATTLVSTAVNEEMPLAGALMKVGASSVDVAALMAPAAENDAPVDVSFGEDDAADEMASAFFCLGAMSVDCFNHKISANELAGALCAAAHRPGLHGAASLLLGHADSGTDARAGVRQRLAQSHGEIGGGWELMVGLARQEFDKVDRTVRAAWRPGVSVAMAFKAAGTCLRQRLAVASPARAPAAAADRRIVMVTGEGEGGQPADAPRVDNRRAVRPDNDEDDDDEDDDDDDDDSGDDAGGGGGAATGPAAGPAGALEALAPQGAVLGSAQSVLASIARGAPVDSIDASDEAATSVQALARLAAVRGVIAESNNNRPLHAALTPHESAGGAEETEKDVAILLRETDAGGWRATRPASWADAAAAVSELVRAVHEVRTAASKAAQVTSTKVPKSALTALSVAAMGDTARSRAIHQGAVAPTVVQALATDTVVLAEMRAEKDGKRAGNPLKVAHLLVKDHGQSAGALLMSNGKARDEVQGSGVAATGVASHGHLAAWLGQQLGDVVGTFKMVEAAAGIKEVKEGIQTGTLTEAVLIQVVRLLGGRQRTKPH